MTFDELFPLKAVINLDKRKDRLASCREEFKKIGVNPVRKPGVLVPQVENPWWRGAIGCMISHYEILQSALMLNSNVAIFEDDIQFIRDDAGEILDKCCKELSSRDWDLFYGSANIMTPFYKISDHLAKLNLGQSTVFYCVNSVFVQKLVDIIGNNLKQITKPIDLIYSQDIIPECNAFISVPMVAIQKDSFSDIEQTYANYSSYLEKRYYENLKE